MRNLEKKNSINKEMIKGSTELLVLKVLSEKNMHGYEMIKVIEEQSSGKFAIKAGTLYPVLHALEKMGAITGEWNQINGERKRKIYKLSELGKSQLKEKESEWVEYSTTINSVLKGKKLSEGYAYGC